MAGGPVAPFSSYIADTAGNLAPGYYAGGGGNAASHFEGYSVKASLPSDASLELCFDVPQVLPTGTLKLRIIALANATTGVAKLTVKDAPSTPAATPTATVNKPSAVTLNAESQTTITWAASEADGMILTTVTLTSTPSAGDVLVMQVLFQTTGWTLATTGFFKFDLIWV